MDIWLFLCHSLWRLSFLHLITSAPFWKSIGHIFVDLSLDFLLYSISISIVLYSISIVFLFSVVFHMFRFYIVFYCIPFHFVLYSIVFHFLLYSIPFHFVLYSICGSMFRFLLYSIVYPYINTRLSWLYGFKVSLKLGSIKLSILFFFNVGYTTLHSFEIS